MHNNTHTYSAVETCLNKGHSDKSYLVANLWQTITVQTQRDIHGKDMQH